MKLKKFNQFLQEINEEPLFENHNEIKSICDKYSIKDYTINVDGSIDVAGNVNLSRRDLTELPITFNYVSGSFNCYSNNLTSLKGSPNRVGGGFNCGFNNLVSLMYSPKEIGGDFSCHGNNLTTLEGAPKEIGSDFSCSYNKLTSLKGAPREVGGNFDCNNNKLTSLVGSPKEIGGDFGCNNNNLPKEILDNIEHIKFIIKNGDDYSIWNSAGTLNIYKFKDMMNSTGISNELTTLEGIPKKIGGEFRL